jgi:PGF-pre-PGF domain-containing protein
VNITFNNNTIVEFNWTFNSSNGLNLYNITIVRQSSGASNGSILIKGLHLGQKKKNAYIDRIANISYVCIKDTEVNSINDISAGCNGASEHFIACTGALTSGYTCNLGRNNTVYYITGLGYSGIREQCRDADGDGYGTGCSLGTDCNDADASKTTDCSTETPSDGGGGGGGGGLRLVSDENTISGSFLTMKEDERYEVKGKRSVLAVTKLAFYIDKFLLKGVVIVNKTGLPSNISDVENAYQYFQITPLEKLTSENVVRAEAQFRVKNSWLRLRSVGKVILFRYKDRWMPYSAKEIDKDINYTYYESFIPGFSYFAIAGEKGELIEEEEEAVITGAAVQEPEEVAEEMNVTGEGGEEVKERLDIRYGKFAFLLALVAVFIVVALKVKDNMAARKQWKPKEIKGKKPKQGK